MDSLCFTMALKHTPFIDSVHYWLAGFRWLMTPGLKRFWIIPLLINTLSICGLIWYFTQMIDDHLLLPLISWLPDWLGGAKKWLENLLIGSLIIFLLPLWLLGFAIFGTLLASPFSGLLAERIIDQANIETDSNLAHWKNWLPLMAKTVAREFAKLAYYLPRALVLLIFTFIPGFNLAAPFLWLLFSAWMAALQYLDYPADILGHSFEDTRQLLWRQKLRTLGFGSVVLMATLVPVLNFLVIPVTVVAATHLWIERYSAIGQNRCYADEE